MALVKNWSGSWGLPDLGITEKIQSIIAPKAVYASGGGSNLSQLVTNPAASYSQTASSQPKMYSTAPMYSTGAKPTPQIVPTTGGGGGANTGQVLGTNTGGGGGVPLEGTPDQGEVDWDAIIQPAVDALNQQSATMQQVYGDTQNQADATGMQRTKEANTAQTAQLGQLEQNKAEQTGATENAVSEARRQASELMQGIQARFGGTTGTGAFSSEILGRSAMQNIASNRQALQNTVAKIDLAEQGVRSQTANLIDRITTEVQQAKTDARNQLAQVLAEIGNKQGELQSNKAQMRMQALQNYQSLVSDINSRNVAFQQQIYTKAQETAAKLQSFKSQAVQTYGTLPEGYKNPFNVGQATYQAVPTSSGGFQYLKGEMDYNNPASQYGTEQSTLPNTPIAGNGAEDLIVNGQY